MSLLFSTGVIAASGLAKSAPGMVLLTPTSITHSGTSASIGANGQVTFTAVTSLSLNGVFSADFDNYVVTLRGVSSGAAPNIQYRLRVSGSDASGSNYTAQRIEVNGTSVTAGRNTSQTRGWFGNWSSSQRTGDTVFLYGPFLAQPTASRNINANGQSSATILDWASTHSLSTSYDGFTIFPDVGDVTGALQVYGVRS